jgi:hypothetical protein
MRDVKLASPWYKDGFGSIMIVDFTISNPTTYRFKDVEIRCSHYAPSGTAIDSNTRTITRSSSRRKSRRCRTSMGFIVEQATQSSCRITDLTVMCSSCKRTGSLQLAGNS